MSIRETFDRLKSGNEMALIAYLTGGFPSLEASMELIRTLSANGADIIEIGIPFSDPIADGPTIQASSQAALEKGVSLPQILEAVSRIQTDTPLVAMSYLNPLLAYGRERLLQDMKAAGFSGLIVPDLPLEEAEKGRGTESGWKTEAIKHGIDLIFLVTPTTSEDRLRRLVDATEGFVYCVSLTGITGERSDLPPHLSEFLGKVKSLTDKPAAVGFGISTPAHVRQLKTMADAVIVGSRIVKAVSEGEDLGSLIRALKAEC
ncbi:tryptophan synthase subunit alpha [bacterium]|nr:tryptophan synthase subunit alpha [bacterium]